VFPLRNIKSIFAENWRSYSDFYLATFELVGRIFSATWQH